jgi:hypothetical protein
MPPVGKIMTLPSKLQDAKVDHHKKWVFHPLHFIFLIWHFSLLQQHFSLLQENFSLLSVAAWASTLRFLWARSSLKGCNSSLSFLFWDCKFCSSCTKSEVSYGGERIFLL